LSSVVFSCFGCLRLSRVVVQRTILRPIYSRSGNVARLLLPRRFPNVTSAPKTVRHRVNFVRRRDRSQLSRHRPRRRRSISESFDQISVRATAKLSSLWRRRGCREKYDGGLQILRRRQTRRFEPIEADRR